MTTTTPISDDGMSSTTVSSSRNMLASRHWLLPAPGLLRYASVSE
ncbi:hypothetical protein [Advenella kashmirensis]|nr:hypothetical protein [Advenella kashmirensis]